MATTFYWTTRSPSSAGVLGDNIKTKATTGSEIIISNVYRPLRKPVTRTKVEIPGRIGSWDFEDGVEQDYSVSVDIVITALKSSNVVACAEAVDTFLDGKQSLIFSDATGTVHTGQIYSEITLTPEGLGNVARATLEFECDTSS